jgi:hypothetical protein
MFSEIRRKCELCCAYLYRHAVSSGDVKHLVYTPEATAPDLAHILEILDAEPVLLLVREHEFAGHEHSNKSPKPACDASNWFLTRLSLRPRTCRRSFGRPLCRLARCDRRTKIPASAPVEVAFAAAAAVRAANLPLLAHADSFLDVHP